MSDESGEKPEGNWVVDMNLQAARGSAAWAEYYREHGDDSTAAWHAQGAADAAGSAAFDATGATQSAAEGAAAAFRSAAGESSLAASSDTAADSDAHSAYASESLSAGKSATDDAIDANGY